MNHRRKAKFSLLHRLTALAVLTFCCLAAVTEPLSVQASAGGTEEGLIVIEDNGQKRWEKEMALNLFSNSDFGGQKLIAPGSSGSYQFTVCNSAGFPMEYKIETKGTNQREIPLYIRLHEKDGQYLIGSETEWADLRENVTAVRELAQDAKHTYILEWKWETRSDADDTAIGIDARSYVDCTINLSVYAEQKTENGQGGSGGNGSGSGGSSASPDRIENSPRTGDVQSPVFYMVFLACAVCGIAVTGICYMRKSKNERKTESR
ncbi:hypothetical protein [Lachnoclostridium sp. An138]|uniref:hypothetical protein n=1 Tax=Lachnoclostridium sp. An138 TaxID=1965560 RepID=UPI000B385DB1|nr:hypothetical protein [Lachnoclostridium sp. An138]OUQ16553.1 hypothetical protein B5E82_12960 [Lachnoclostridium sp. An138]